MTYGDPYSGLLKAMIDEVRAIGPGGTFRTVEITEALLKKKFWGLRPPETPERTVNMYCSQNPHIFFHVGEDEYKLVPGW